MPGATERTGVGSTRDSDPSLVLSYVGVNKQMMEHAKTKAKKGEDYFNELKNSNSANNQGKSEGNNSQSQRRKSPSRT